MRVWLALLCLPLVASCTLHDNEGFPYAMTGIDAFVYDEFGTQYFAGYVPGYYWQRAGSSASCWTLAKALAESQSMGHKWTFICCAHTPRSICEATVPARLKSR